jgi:hypothetical protein
MPNNIADIQSAVSSLKKIVTIVSGLAITNTLNTLVVTQANRVNLLGFVHLQWYRLLLSALLIITIVRFHHGNIRLLDKTYLLGEEEEVRSTSIPRKRQLLFDFVVIFLTSVLLAFMSFFIGPDFFPLFAILLFVDLVWFLVTNRWSGDSVQQKWAINNLMFGLGIIILLFSQASLLQAGISSVWVNMAYVILVSGNTCYDFFISRELYFPNPNPRPSYSMSTELNGPRLP